MSQKLKFIIAVSLQILFLLFIIFNHQMALSQGKKILLKTAPVDPRSLFSGDYVTLNYEISRIDLSTVETDIEYNKNQAKNYKYSMNDPKKDVYVKLIKKPDLKYWTPVSVTYLKPKLNDDEVFVVGKKQYSWGEIDIINISYDFESYYVQEGTGNALEGTMRNGSEIETLVEISLTGNGKGLINKIYQDGKEIK